MCTEASKTNRFVAYSRQNYSLGFSNCQPPARPLGHTAGFHRPRDDTSDDWGYQGAHHWPAGHDNILQNRFQPVWSQRDGVVIGCDVISALQATWRTESSHPDAGDVRRGDEPQRVPRSWSGAEENRTERTSARKAEKENLLFLKKNNIKIERKLKV